MKVSDCRKRRKRACDRGKRGKEPARRKRCTAHPGNAGIAEYAECVDIGAMEFDKLTVFCEGGQRLTL